MISLEINNSYSRITGLSAAQEKELRKVLSYTIGGSAAYFSGFGIRRKSLIDKKGYFSTGLLSKLLNSLDSDFKIIDNRKKPKVKPIIANISGLRQWQIDATDTAVNHHRGIISAPTGTGKSRVIELISQFLGLKTLVVVPTLEIKKQLSESILESLGTNHKVTVENIDCRALKTMKDFDCLIIDEAHHVASKTYRMLNKTAWDGIYYRFFFTATPFRNDSEEQLLFESIAGEVIYKLDYHTAIKENYIVPIEAYYIEMPKQPTDAYTYAEVYKELVVQNVPRNLAISKLLTQLHSAQKSTLCLVKEVRHGKILSEITGLPFVSGEDEYSRKYIDWFNKGSIKVLIGTTGILGEGIDSRPCEYVIVAGLGKAKSQFMQQIGRSVRKYFGKETAKVIIVKDKSHKFCSRHFKAQCDILKEEYGVTCEKLEIK